MSQMKKDTMNWCMIQGQLVRMVPVWVGFCVVKNLLQVWFLLAMIMEVHLFCKLIFVCNVEWVPESVYVPTTPYNVPEVLL